MGIKERVQDDMKAAMKAKDGFRLECLRMVKAALTMKEKESNEELSDERSIAVLRSEIRKREQSIEIFREHNRPEEAEAAEREIALIQGYLPRQLGADEVEARIRAYLAEHPEIDHAGKLTGALKKELGDAVDGKLLNELCRKALEA